MLSLVQKTTHVRNHSVLAHAAGLVNAVKQPVAVGIAKMFEDNLKQSNRIAAQMAAKRRKIETVMERQRKRDVAAAYGDIIPFDKNDILQY